MATYDNLITLSAFSGLAGALATQAITAANSYFTDKRKRKAELSNLYRAKKIEIGENFYYVAGEKMAVIKKTIGYSKNWNQARSRDSLEFLKKETQRLNGFIEKLDADNWKYNLIHLYFKLSLTNDELIKNNELSKKHYLRFLDISQQIREAGETDTEKLYEAYAVGLFDMCMHYEALYKKMEHDMNAVRAELLAGFVA